MNQELSFETMPFELDPEIQGEIFEEESERGGRRPFAGGASRSFRPRSQPGLRPKGTKRPPIPRLRVIPRKPRRPWEVIREPYGLVSEPYPGEPEPSGSERVRWLQDCLNQSTGVQLPVTGVMGPETRRAVKNFQRQQGLRATGIAGPDTEEALRAACENRGGQPSSEEMEFGAIYESEWPEMELPAAFRDNYSRLLSHMSPADQGLWATGRCYRLSQWDRAPAQGGIYLLVFHEPMQAGRIGYVGESGNLRKRMQGYHRDVIFLGLDPDNYAFCYARTPERGIIEGRLRDILNPTGLVTNQRELEMELQSPFSEAEEIELAAELLAVSSEEELDQFLGKLFKGIGRGLKKVGRFIGRRVLPALGKGLKALGKTALPILGKALGSFIPIPGVGTAIGGALGTAVSKALELEFSGLSSEEAELEIARRIVRIAGAAARQAALADPNADPQAAVNTALLAAARQYVPNLPAKIANSGRALNNSNGYTHTGHWVRRGNRIAVMGA